MADYSYSISSFNSNQSFEDDAFVEAKLCELEQMNYSLTNRTNKSV